MSMHFSPHPHPAQAGGRPSFRQVEGPGTEWQTFQYGYTALILKKKKKKILEPYYLPEVNSMYLTYFGEK